MKHITTECCDANPVSQHPDDTEPDQLSLRFFALIEGYKRLPPDRALWRELVNLAVGQLKSFRDGARTVSASTLVLVAYALYMRANSAGIIEDFSATLIASDCRIGREHAQAALRVLNRLHVFRSTRASRRRPACHRMNLGGLDWPAVRARLRRSSGDRGSLLEDASGALLGHPSGDPGSLLGRPSGDRGSLLEDPSGDPGSPLSGDPGSPLKGNKKGSQESLAVAAGTPSARETNRQQQQQRQQDRIEGLIGAIAARAREVGRKYDEADERRRLAEGEIDVDDMQRLADKLGEEVRERRLRRIHGPSYRHHR